jgi:uncharacterized membrane protein YeaQ/YmgE (transglycosylase-associated protein family)
MYADPFVTLIIVTLIGAAVGIIYERMMGASWFTRQISNSQRRMVTYALVGVAGAFIGFHLFAALGIYLSGAGLYLGAILIAALVLWLWQQLR